MAYEQRDNTGSLFANDKRTEDTHANARGSALIAGVEYWVDAWTKTTKEGKKWQSLSFKRKDAAKSQPTRAPAKAAAPDDFADEIPF